MFKSRDLGSNFETIGKYMKESPAQPAKETVPLAKTETAAKFSTKFENAYAELLADPAKAVEHLATNFRTVGSTIELSPKKFAELTAAVKRPEAGAKIPATEKPKEVSTATQMVAEKGQAKVEATAAKAQTRVETAHLTFMDKVGKASGWLEAAKIVGGHFKENRKKKELKQARETQKSWLGEQLAQLAKTMAEAQKKKEQIAAELAEIDSLLQTDAA